MLAIFLFLSLANGLCFTPDGSLSNDVACNPNDSASICCTAGFLCMSNGLCQTAGAFAKGSDQFIRGTCTDKSWSAPECRGFCVKENPSGGEWVMRCSNGTATTQGSWCCARDDCCESDATKLKLENAVVTATAGARSTTSSASAAGTNTGASTSITPPTSAVHSSGSPTSEPSSSETSSSSSNALAIGLGVGLGGAVVVVLAGLWIVWRKKKTVPRSVAGDDGGWNGRAELHSDGRSPGPNPPPELNGHFQGYQLPSQLEKSPVELPGNAVQINQTRSYNSDTTNLST